MTNPPVIKEVEIKATVEAEAASAAAAAFGLQLPQAKRQQIWFCESRSGIEKHRLALLERKLILRLRKSPDESDDATVKIRSTGEIPLDASWADKFTVEGDWSATTQMVSASLKMDVEEGLIDAAVRAGGNPGIGFNELQLDFLSTGWTPPVESTQLVALGPVEALKWSAKGLLPMPFQKARLNFERWEIPNLVFLEFSVRVDWAQATAAQQALTNLLTGRGITVGEHQQPKTSRVLYRLAGISDQDSQSLIGQPPG
jgi:hypothetical protein